MGERTGTGTVTGAVMWRRAQVRTSEADGWRVEGNDQVGVALYQERR